MLKKNMETKFIPEPITLTPMYIHDLFGVKSRDLIVVFEDQIQRPFMWTKYNIENDFMYDVFDTIKHNIIEENERKHIYNEIGELVVSELDECSKKYFRVDNPQDKIYNKSNIDAGHRFKLSFATKFVLEVLSQNDDDIFNATPFINSDKSLKIDGTKQKEFDGVKKLIQNTYKVKEIKKQISKVNKKLFNTTKDKTLLDVICFVYGYIKEKIENDEILSNVDKNLINKYFDEYNFFYFSSVPLSQKWFNFLTRNTGGQQATNEQMIPRDIGNYFNNLPGANEEIVNESNKVKEISEKCEKESIFVPTKKGYGMFLYGMQETLKNEYYKKGVSTLKGDIIEDEKYNIISALKIHNIFKTKEDGILFFKKTYDFVDFVFRTINFDEKIEKTYTFFLNEDRVKPCVWWYFLMPFFLLSKLNNTEVEKKVHDILLRGRAFYMLYKNFATETNVQYFIDFLGKVSNIIIRYEQDTDLMLNKIEELLYIDVLSHVKNVKKEYPNKSKKELFNMNIDVFRYGIVDLKYGNVSQKKLMKKILFYNEYITIKENELSHYNLHKMLISNDSVNLDHIIPYSVIKTNFQKEEYDETPIGNLVLLNEYSNKQKGADISKNDSVYRESNIYTTCLLVEDVRNGLSNDTLKNIKMKRYSKDELNSEHFDYKKRTEEITDRVVEWIFNYKRDNIDEFFNNTENEIIEDTENEDFYEE
ncbi:hypothetical protein IJ182_11870 [bacterium]|nr:hypothetical protein [bacterium]MBQ9246950.1 hypothetical protein [bacterium]